MKKNKKQLHKKLSVILTKLSISKGQSLADG